MNPLQTIVGNNPYTKLDTQNIVSFQTISLLFNNEPDQPTLADEQNTDTLVYEFKHGYNYIPTIWLTWYNSSPEFPPDPDIGNTATTFFNFGDETANGNIPQLGEAESLSLIGYVNYNDPIYGIEKFTTAFLYAKVKTNNIYIYIRKQALFSTSDNTIVPIYLAGITLNMRCYVFTEPADTSTY